MNFFGRHSNEAFSTLAVEDWKHFLRLHIDADGSLTIYPVGIRRVPRKWKERAGGGGVQEYVPADPEATPPALIEPPVLLKTSATQTGVAAASPNGRGATAAAAAL